MNASTKRLIAIVSVATIAIAISARAKAVEKPLKTVAHVDLPRYMGDWRVIANIPYFAEKGCIDSIESYGLRKDGDIDNWFRYRKGSFANPQKRIDATKAVVTNKQTNAEWTVSFVGGLIRAKYLVLDLDPHYQWVVVGHPSRNYGWIMAREKTMPEATYQAILRRLQAQGYDPRRFVKVPQLPSQLPPAKKA
jgi:apolipoprotein D and lipocalin family protein